MPETPLQRLHRALDQFREEHGADPDRIRIDPELRTEWDFVANPRGAIYELHLSPSFAASLLQ